MRATRPLNVVQTPSFEAYRLYALAAQRRWVGDPKASIQLLERALELDPDFAGAWAALAVSYQNRYELEPARAAMAQAIQRPDRATPVQHLMWRAGQESFNWRQREELALLDMVLGLEPGHVTAIGNRAVCLSLLERHDEALAETRRARSSAPFGASQGMWWNEISGLTFLSRTAEARELLPRMESPEIAAVLELHILAAEERWAEVENLGRQLAGGSHASETGVWMSAAAAGARGAARQAERELRAASEGAAPVTLGGSSMIDQRVWLMAASGNRVVEMPPWLIADTTYTGALLRGLWAAAAGDADQAAAQLRAAEARRPLVHERTEPLVTLLRAWIEALHDRPAAVVDSLASLARSSLVSDWGGRTDLRGTARLLVADAHAILGHHDSSAVYLEKILGDVGGDRGAIAWAFVRSKLVLTYARLGRLEDARRHWEKLERDVDKPDPEVATLMADARAALASAEAMTPVP